ncbi:MAG: response regulator, partial [Nostoc sp. C3-bin3]|nr:response regulator [Nostoc sp. C3-bin3]
FLAQSSQPDAILLDVMMPDMDGLTTFKKLQTNQKTKDIPVILLTARGRSNDKHIFNDLGVKGIISKPFNPQKLADQVAAALS